MSNLIPILIPVNFLLYIEPFLHLGVGGATFITVPAELKGKPCSGGAEELLKDIPGLGLTVLRALNTGRLSRMPEEGRGDNQGHEDSGTMEQKQAVKEQGLVILLILRPCVVTYVVLRRRRFRDPVALFPKP